MRTSKIVANYVPLVLVVSAFVACGGVTRLEFDDDEGSGGAASSGGTASAGGSKSAGGKPSNGGKPNTGGRTSTGGYTGYGGVASAGGASSYGGYGAVTGYGGAIGAGGSPATPNEVWAKDFLRKCTYDSDCMLVSEGIQCGCNICNNAAIAAFALSSWKDRLSEVQCGPTPPCDPIGCLNLAAVCTSAGMCGAREVFPQQPYDAQCTTDADCSVVPSGPLCSTCVCGMTPVSQTGRKQYEQDTADADCHPGPGGCDCVPQPATPRCMPTPTGTGSCVL